MNRTTTWTPEAVVTAVLTDRPPEELPIHDFNAYFELRLALGRAKEELDGERLCVPGALTFIEDGAECYGKPAGLNWRRLCWAVVLEAREYLKAWWALDAPADWDDGFVHEVYSTPQEAAQQAARRLGFAYWLAGELLQLLPGQPDATGADVLDRATASR